jgi:hypothetical protein
VGVSLQLIGHAVNVKHVSLAHDGALYCGNGINCRYPSGENIAAILAELLDSACHLFQITPSLA